MFEQYHSIEDLLREEKMAIIDEFNHQPLYVKTVRKLGFKEIGIIVLDEMGRVIGVYASHNNKKGEVTDIVSYHLSPNIVARATEETLLKIVQNAEEVKIHPIASFFRYGHNFEMRRGDYLKLLKAVMDIKLF